MGREWEDGRTGRVGTAGVFVVDMTSGRRRRRRSRGGGGCLVKNMPTGTGPLEQHPGQVRHTSRSRQGTGQSTVCIAHPGSPMHASGHRGGAVIMLCALAIGSRVVRDTLCVSSSPPAYPHSLPFPPPPLHPAISIWCREVGGFEV